MAYSTAAEFKAAFPEDEVVQITNLDDPTATSSNDDRITEALIRASSEIDSYVGIAVGLPLASVPLVLKGKELDIARYYLDSYDPREDVRRRYEDAVAWLKLIAEGKASLGVDTNGTEVVSGSPFPAFYTNDRVFTPSTLQGY